MQIESREKQSTETHPFLAGGGETGNLIRSFDWSSTPLGPVNHWPQSLKTCIRIILTSRQPMFVWWGQELINIYNDAYISIARGKHPQALGQPASVVWREIWDKLGPRAATVMEKDEGTYDEALLLIMERNGYPEETYYTFSYSPVPGDVGGTSGIICANTDDTERIISERQLRNLKDLGKNLIDCKSNNEVFANAINVLRENLQDFPFACIYEVAEEGLSIKLAAVPGNDSCGNMKTMMEVNEVTASLMGIAEAVNTGKMQIVERPEEIVGDLPHGAWTVPPKQALILPIIQKGNKHPYAILLVGLNPYRLPDEKYLSFFQLVADQVATSISNMHALGERTKDLKEANENLERSNRELEQFAFVTSHDLQEPLRKIQTFANIIFEKNQDLLDERGRDYLDKMMHASKRMSKLINDLLDFSRLRKTEENYIETDIDKVFSEVSNDFKMLIKQKQAVITREGLPVIEANTLQMNQLFYNLLSNALKFNKHGVPPVILVKARKLSESEVSRFQELSKQQVYHEISITDNGIGFPQEYAEKIFEIFQRLHPRSRFEGTGIGLALVKKIINNHKGVVYARSVEGEGATFHIVLPEKYK